MMTRPQLGQPPPRWGSGPSLRWNQARSGDGMRFIDYFLSRLTKRETRCYRCGKKFRPMTPCVNGEIGPFFSRLWDAKYTCVLCVLSFHGSCAARGRSGETPGFVRVTCPSCRQEANYPMPFEVETYGANDRDRRRQ